MTPLQVRQMGYCAALMDGPHSEVFCVRPRSHPGAHMDAADDCVWCGRLIRPEAVGDGTPARNEHGVWFHRGCLFALDGERLGIRRVAA